MENIQAVVATAYGEGGSSVRFSGFEEELTGSPGTVARPHHRVITGAGRKGGTFARKSYGWARMEPEQKIPSIIDLDKIPEENRFPAMINMIAEGKTREKFTPDYIFDNYIAKAMIGLWPGKGR